ncbi:MAG: hypothetical protein KF859_05620 [Phycisphaeraceae bacterium]|nr:hypothetical protein [Phycisphaeraceae bacterium]
MTTAIPKAPKKGVTLNDPKAAQRVLEEAMKQPGVRDLMEAYGEAKRYQDAAASYKAVLATRTVEWASDSTTTECV